MVKQNHPMSVRPSKGKAEQVAKRLLAEGRWNSTINDILESMADDSPAILQIEIKELNDKRTKLMLEVTEIDREIIDKRARLDSFIHRDESVIEAQTIILTEYKRIMKEGNSSLRAEYQFGQWISGPANLELMGKAGFKNEQDVIKWCKMKVAQ
jgi:hypothetical protein